MSKSCSAPTLDNVNITVDGDESMGPGESEMDEAVQLLPVAAHMKLLLDAPEGEIYAASCHGQKRKLMSEKYSSAVLLSVASCFP